MTHVAFETTAPALLDITPDSVVAAVTAHPDDLEVMLGYGIMHAGSVGAEVHAYIATDGERSTIGDPKFVRNGGRILEAKEGAATLNIPKVRLHMPHFKDGSLSDWPWGLEIAVKQFFTKHNITTALTLGEQGGDGHPDHIAIHRAAVAASAGTVAVWGLQHGSEEHGLILPSAEMRARKLTAVSRHSSQYPPEPDGSISARHKPYSHFLEKETYIKYA
ncbi:MAG: PIG-L family deacetylase [Candidatus Saccharimonadales bacterium]